MGSPLQKELITFFSSLPKEAHVELTVNLTYVHKSGGSAEPLERDMLELHLDMLISSLYGKVGAASLYYEVKDYSRKHSKLTLLTDSE